MCQVLDDASQPRHVVPLLADKVILKLISLDFSFYPTFAVLVVAPVVILSHVH